MPTFPLFTPPTHPDGWHRVSVPGGGESWTFDVQSGDGRTTLLIGFHLGDPLNRRYARRYVRYRAMPTRFKPPLPAEFASVATTMIEGDRVAARFMNVVPGPEVIAAGDALRLRFGASHVESRADGGIHLSIRANDKAGRTLSADLVFTPVFRAIHRLNRTPHETIILNDPLHRVEGELQAFDGSGTSPRVRQIEGLGYHQHVVALRSVLDERKPIVRARAIGDNRAVIACGDRAVTITSAGVAEAPPIPWSADRARVIDASFASKLFRYDSHPPLGSALASIVYPRRLAARAFI